MIPLTVDWRITSSCHMRCPFCYGPKGIPSLALAGSLKVISTLDKMGVETVCLSGGEPLLYKFIKDVLIQLRKRNIEVYLSTSGIGYFTYAEVIEECVTKLSLPLDGHTERLQKACGRTATSFRDVMKILDYYRDKDRNFQIKIATLITKRNVNKSLGPLFRLLMGYPIDIWKIYELLPEGMAKRNFHELGYSETEFDNAIKRLNKQIKHPPNFEIVISRRKDRDSGYFIIQPDGTVIIPVDEKHAINEMPIGKMLIDPIEDIVSNWQDNANIRNYLSNIRIREKKGEIDQIDKHILFELDRDPRQGQGELSKTIRVNEELIRERISNLFKNGIIKAIIPIINLDKLGLDVYLVNLVLGAVDKEGFHNIITSLVNNVNVAWVVRSRGKWAIMIAIFARGPEEVMEIIRQIKKDCGEMVVAHDTHVVYEKYILGQRYLKYGGRKTGFLFDSSRIKLEGRQKANISTKQHLVLRKIRESKNASIEYISMQLGIPVEEVKNIVDELTKVDIIKKFQPIYDVAKLGYEWYEVFIRFKNVTEHKTDEFFEYIKRIPQVVHINLTMGAWEANFEVHVKSKQEFLYLYRSIKSRYANIIREEEFVRIDEEYKFSFLVEVVLEEASKRIV